MAKIGQHVLQQHPDHHLVLDNEDALAGCGIALKRHPKYRAPAAIDNISKHMRHPASRNDPSASCRTECPCPPLNAEVPPPVPGRTLTWRCKLLRHNGKKGAAFLREVAVAGIKSDDVERMGFQLTLRRRGISDQAVLRAMDEVPREHFVTSEFVESAYADQALPIACGQTISQPYVVAYMTEQLEVGPQHRVLEVGTGSGYQAAVLSRLAREVVSIERYRTLADTARDRLKTLGYSNVTVIAGDGFAGAPDRRAV